MPVIRKISAAILSVFAALIFFEAGLRLSGREKPAWSFYYPRYYLADHPTLGFFPTPSFSAPWKKFLLANNAEGFRDVERAFEKTPGALRILGLGDSQTWGASVPVESTYLRQFAAMADRSKNHPPVEVILGGVPGYASDQAVERLRLEGPRFKPDVVFLALFLDYQYGDLPRLLAHQRYGLYRVAAGYSLPSDWARRVSRRGITGRLCRGALFLLTHSYVGAVCYRGAVEPFVSRRFYVPLDDPRSADGESALGLIRENLKNFESSCRSLGAKPVLIFIPSLAHYLRPDPAVEFFNREIARQAAELRLPALDLRPRFYADLAGSKPLYFPDNHLSPVGHQVVAEELLKFAERGKWWRNKF